MESEPYSQGSVHGRFQPFHNGHLKYVLEAKKRCNYLWIGITQFNVDALAASPKDTHRQKRMHNPFTYFERVEMITNALLDNGLNQNKFSIIPFPIEMPSCLNGFLPISVPIFTTINDKWNEEKIYTLKQAGYKVLVLWKDQEKTINGIKIRELIYNGDESWQLLVPKATIKVVEKYKIRKRLIELIDSEVG